MWQEWFIPGLSIVLCSFWIVKFSGLFLVQGTNFLSNIVSYIFSLSGTVVISSLLLNQISYKIQERNECAALIIEEAETLLKEPILENRHENNLEPIEQIRSTFNQQLITIQSEPVFYLEQKQSLPIKKITFALLGSGTLGGLLWCAYKNVKKQENPKKRIRPLDSYTFERNPAQPQNYKNNQVLGHNDLSDADESSLKKIYNKFKFFLLRKRNEA